MSSFCYEDQSTVKSEFECELAIQFKSSCLVHAITPLRQVQHHMKLDYEHSRVSGIKSFRN